MNIVLRLEKCETKASCPCFARVRNCSAFAVVRSGRNGLIDLFPPAFVNLQISQVDRMRILQRVVFRSSSLCAGVFVTSLFFLLKIDDFEISSLSFTVKVRLLTPNSNRSGASY